MNSIKVIKASKGGRLLAVLTGLLGSAAWIVFGTALGVLTQGVAQQTALPMVSVEATVAETAEPTPNTRIRPGVFLFQRTGDVSVGLKVLFVVGGTAVPGQDYVAFADKVAVFAPGSNVVEVLVMPLEDDVIEGPETVAVELVLPPSGQIPEYTVDPAHKAARIVIADSTALTVPVLEWLAPKDGETFAVGKSVSLQVRAVDPAGYISKVEFYDRGQFLGESGLWFFQAPDPGEPILHDWNYGNPEVGVHSVTARAKDSVGGEVVSPPLSFVVVAATDGRPVVSIVADDPVAQEPASADQGLDTALFRVLASSAVTNDLLVFYSVGGTATPGVDYQPLSASIVIPKGERSTTIEVLPMPDTDPEDSESVVITLTPDPRVGPGPLPDEYVIDPQRGEAVAKILDGAPVGRATLVITEPKEGAAVQLGVKTVVSATAGDPLGEIREVEFFDGDQRIGVSLILTRDVVIPGRPRVHTCEWLPATPGAHRLQARARDTSGQPVLSQLVTVTVREASRQVVLEVRAVDAFASEDSSVTGAADPAVFVVERVAGPVEVAVPVFFSLEGTAVNGVDYVMSDGTATLEAGQTSVQVVITPIADKALEGEETVLLKLEPPICIQIFPPPPSCYLIGVQGQARAVIRDEAKPVGRPPVVKLVTPHEGSVFTVGDAIEVRAEASDPDGKVTRLEAYAGDALLGSTAEGSLTVRWTDAREGYHTLFALAANETGLEAKSAPVRVLVRAIETRAFVERGLPPAFVPGEKFTVVLRVNPPLTGKAYAVEDIPPAGWTVSAISDDGVVDPVNGHVKFGPFTDLVRRQLTYQVTPSLDALGRGEFRGLSALDGKFFPILGDQIIESAGGRHPADISPPDQRISITELSAYAAAWQEGAAWPEGPVPISASFLTRAAALWKGGESYGFDAAAGEPPLCWKSVPGTTQSPPPPGSVVREAPELIVPGVPAVVRIGVTPVSGVAAYAIEESLPPGWRVSNVGENGSLLSSSGMIRWGPFLGDQPRVLTYNVTAPSGVASAAVFDGRAAFDGFTQVIGGAEKAGAADAQTGLRISGAERTAESKLRLQIHGKAGQLCVLEASSDLNRWIELEQTIVGDNGSVSIEDTGIQVQARFYRLRVPFGPSGIPE